MTINEYKGKFLELHEQLEREYGAKADVHIYEEKETYGHWVTTIEIKF